MESDSPFRLNVYTLEPACFPAGHSALSSHLDLTALADGELAEELHVSVRKNASYSVDQVLVPGRSSGYAIYNTFDTGTSGTDPDIDPQQTGVDMFAPDGDRIAKRDVIVCISDHNDDVQNEPYVTDVVPGEVAAIDRPIIQPAIACLGASAIEPLNTYKVGMGYSVVRWYEPFRGLPITDPQHYSDHVLIKYRADQPGVRRVNDIDESGELYSDPHDEKSGYGQPIVFHKNGDPQAYLHKSLPGTVDGGSWPTAFQEAFADQTSALGLFTFTAQGDLPIKWTVKASLAQTSSTRSVMTLDDAMLRAWEASWQAYYDGGAKPTMPLCPGTNSPAPDTTVVVNLPQTAQPVVTPGGTTTVIKETTTVQTVAGATVIKKVAAKSKSKKAACAKKAKAKKGKAKKRAMRKCRRVK